MLTGIAYPPGTPGTEKADKGLIGTWKQSDGLKEVVSIRISETDKYTLKAEVLERGDIYALESDVLVARCTEIGGKNFVYFETTTEGKTEYYTYMYQFVSGGLETCVVSLMDGGVDAITSTESYRSQLEKSIGMENAISDTTFWIRQ
jgi:hypothetical protein